MKCQHCPAEAVMSCIEDGCETPLCRECLERLDPDSAELNEAILGKRVLN